MPQVWLRDETVPSWLLSRATTKFAVLAAQPTQGVGEAAPLCNSPS